jgi:hypothetical protein
MVVRVENDDAVAAPARRPARARTIAIPAPTSVSRAVLLAIYAAVPLCLLAAIVDRVAFDGALRQILPRTPDSILLYLIVFNLPHIVASTLIFFDGEYVAHYRHRLLGPSIAIAGFVIWGPSVIGIALFSAIIYAVTIWHAIGQQFGLAGMMAKTSKRWLRVWKVSGFGAGAAVYFAIYAREATAGGTLTIAVATIFALSLVVFTAATIIGARHAAAGYGRAFLWVNYALVTAAAMLFALGYPLLVILMARIVHDCTAFCFYVVHDQNRNAAAPRNFIYRLFGPLHPPALLLCPLAAMAIAFPLTWYYHVAWVAWLVLGISLLHYYTEGFTWRGDAPHRRAIAIT